MGELQSAEAYKAGERVVYKSNGICTITEIQKKKFAGVEREYYVLESISDGHGTWYVPVDSPELVASINRILSTDEIDELIDGSADLEEIWDDNYKERANLFNSILKSGDRTKILAVYKTLSLRKNSAEKSRRKLYVSDERALHSAEKIITDEFSYVLGIQRAEVVPYILARIGINEAE